MTNNFCFEKDGFSKSDVMESFDVFKHHNLMKTDEALNLFSHLFSFWNVI
jgi:hypothetical protein